MHHSTFGAVPIFVYVYGYGGRGRENGKRTRVSSSLGGLGIECMRVDSTTCIILFPWYVWGACIRIHATDVRLTLQCCYHI